MAITSAGSTARLGGRAVRHAVWEGLVPGSNALWAGAFVLPYIAVFLAFVIFPVGYGLWLGSAPATYRALFNDPIYMETVVNTLIFLAVGVNLKLFLALMLSGFFMRPQRWVKWLLLIFILPWAVPAIPTFISINWMLNGQWGFINNVIWTLFQVDGPPWLDNGSLALASNIVAYIWKWMPFWTLIFLAGRMAIPQELYESASVDGATGLNRFVHITFPIMANLYLVCTLLSVIWTLGDFNTVHFVSGGGPALQTHVLATLGIRDAFELSQPRLGMAAVISALPLLIPLVIVLMRKMGKGEVQL
ncbi:carbohydrate ABC transporter permease [Limobrevibacterium gyesilva]|uniref:Sugar ABC transporter permease n=1 Tax=Limobrevibacterium gyesilva TaxID=2991712 RepID=A0AA42CFT6_9PROT|nr:sugar ABC transporter permease [Limobrevibacterium gyesilva]MCW3475261.1 sugar ABC transporter permease [Limobrevibacterium gyesilva]